MQLTTTWILGIMISLIGYAVLAFVLRKAVRALINIIYPYKFAVPQNLQVLAGSRWAVITGSTDGIGKAYAFELAKKGFDLVLISRTQLKLDSTANEIREKYSTVTIKTIAFDFTTASLQEYENHLFSALGQLEVGILVNNVGLSYEYPERLDKLDGGLKRVTDITVINTLPTTLLSAFVLKQMAERKHGVVVNLASSAAYFPMAYWAIYSATKKYVCWLSDILRKEYSNSGVTIQTVCPMMVATKMSKVRKTSFFTPSPERFAKEAVGSIGHVEETTGCFAHQIQATIFFGLLPSFLVDKFTTSNSLQTRSRALKKKAAAEKNE